MLLPPGKPDSPARPNFARLADGRRSRIGLLVVAAYLIVAGVLPAKPPVVAILSEPGSDTVADMLAVAISAQGGARLVERDRIGHIADEKGLARWSDVERAIQRGRMAGADALIHISPDTAGDARRIRMRIVSTRMVLLLHDRIYAWKPDHPDEAADLLSRDAALYWNKLSSDPGNRIVLSMLGIRSPVAWHETAGLEETITQTLIRKLIASPNLVIRDSRRLLDVAWERDLAAVDSTIHAAYFLEGEIEKNPDSPTFKLAIHIRGRNVAPVTFHVNGSVHELDDVIAGLSRRLSNHLALPAFEVTFDDIAHADRYYREALWAYDSRQYDLAVESANAAWFMGLRSPALLELRVRANAQAAFPAEKHAMFYRSGILKADMIRGSLEKIIVALDSYDTLTRLPDVQNVNIASLGVDLLGSASSVVRGVHELGGHFAHSDAMAYLQRRIVSTVQQLESIRKTAPFPEAVHLDRYRNNFAPYWYADYRQTLDHYRKLLDEKKAEFILAGYTQPPLLIAWRRGDESVIASLSENFINQLRSSNNSYERVAGIFLAINAAGRRPALVNDLRSELFKEIEPNILMYFRGYPIQVVDSLKNMLSYVDCRPEWTESWWRMVIAYLDNESPGNRAVMSTMLGLKTDSIISQHWLPDLRSAFSRYLERKGPSELPDHLNNLLHDFGNRIGHEKKASREVRSDHPLKVRRFWHPSENPVFRTRMAPHTSIHSITRFHDQLWFVCLNQYEKSVGFVGALDLPSARSLMIPIPEPGQKGGGSSLSLAVSKDYLGFPINNRIMIYNRKNRSWSTANLPELDCNNLEFINDRLVFYTNPSSQNDYGAIISMDPASSDFDLISSTRRRPARNALDEASAYGVSRFVQGFDGELWGVFFMNAGQLGRGILSYADGQWVSKYPMDFGANIISNDGYDKLVTWDVGDKGSLSVINRSASLLQTLFGSPFLHNQIKNSEGPAWEWPSDFKRWRNVYDGVYDGINYWQLARKLSDSDKNMYLLRFSPGQSYPAFVRLEFEHSLWRQSSSSNLEFCRIYAGGDQLVVSHTHGFAFINADEISPHFAPAVGSMDSAK